MSRSASHPNSPRNTSSDNRSLRQRMSQDLQLQGKAKRTHDGYLREVRKLACYYNSPPDRLSEQQVGKYLLYLINECDFAPGSLGVAYSGIKFFYTVTEPRDWDVLKKLRRPKQKTLPSVLTIEEVHRLIGAVKQHRHAAYFWTVYSLGLRLEEGLNLHLGDIDAKRMLVHVHRGKGAKDRYVPWRRVRCGCCGTTGRPIGIRRGCFQPWGGIGKELPPPPKTWTPTRCKAA